VLALRQPSLKKQMAAIWDSPNSCREEYFRAIFDIATTIKDLHFVVVNSGNTTFLDASRRAHTAAHFAITAHGGRLSKMLHYPYLSVQAAATHLMSIVCGFYDMLQKRGIVISPASNDFKMIKHAGSLAHAIQVVYHGVIE